MKTRIQMVADLADALQEALIFAFEEGDPVWAEDTILKCVKALREAGHGVPLSITEALNEITHRRNGADPGRERTTEANG